MDNKSSKEQLTVAVRALGEANAEHSSDVSIGYASAIDDVLALLRSAVETPAPHADGLAAAWRKYVAAFGEPPHGTLSQLKALLEFMPKPVQAEGFTGPRTDWLGKSMAENLAAIEEWNRSSALKTPVQPGKFGASFNNYELEKSAALKTPADPVAERRDAPLWAGDGPGKPVT